MTSMHDYCLTSTESNTFQKPRKCWLLKRLSCGDRDDLAFIRIEPSAIFRDYTGNELELNEVIICSRLAGMNIFHPKEWPIHVYIAITNNKLEDKQNNIEDDNLRIISWGELHPASLIKKSA